MRTVELVARFHSPEPAVGSIRTSDGQRADLFNARHYPVQATCRVCREPIQADSFLRPFRHHEDEPAALAAAGSRQPAAAVARPRQSAVGFVAVADRRACRA